jgi:phospholipid/cholesterol/gamma-HCH transport system substrate-binding protein
LKVSKEFKTGLVVIIAIATLVVGVNFLKGINLFSQEMTVYAKYDRISSNLSTSSVVKYRGIVVGQVRSTQLNPDNPSEVVVEFAITHDELRIPEHSIAKIVTPVIGDSWIELQLSDTTDTYIESGDFIVGVLDRTVTEALDEELAPVKRKLEDLMGSIDDIVVSIGAFWDTSAAYTIDESLYEVKAAISKFGLTATKLNLLIDNETERLGRIFANVEGITSNLRLSNAKISGIISNVEGLTDSLVKSDFKLVIKEAKNTLQHVNSLMKDIQNGEGTIGKLIHDDSLYTELIITNKRLQNLVDDLQAHPERYIHFSVFGKKTKGVQLTPADEKNLRIMLDTIK